MPVSEPEKHGVSVFGRCFSEKAEHVPIKKRRFLLRNFPRSLSPPPPPPPPQSAISSQPAEEISDQLKGHHSSNELVAKETGSMNLSHTTDDSIKNHAKKFEKPIIKLGGDEDFSGMSILAAAACSNSLGNYGADAADGSGLEECLPRNRAHDICDNIDDHSSSRGVLKEDFVKSCEMLTGGTSSCVSMKPAAQLASILTSVNSCQNVECAGEGMKDAPSVSGYLTPSSDVKDEETVGNQKASSRDDRLHWDLNVVMDAWKLPLEDSCTHNEHNDGKHNDDDKRMTSDSHESQDKMAITCTEQNNLLDRESEMSIKHTLEGNKSNHNVDDHCKISLPVSSDVKPLLSNCNNDLDVVGYVDEATNMHHEESVNNTDALFQTASNHTSQLSASGMEEVEDASANSPELNVGVLNNCSSTMEVLSSHAGASPRVLENLGTECASSIPHGSGSSDIPTTICVSSVDDIGRQVTPTLMGNLETSQRLHDHVDAVEGKVNLNTVGNSNGMFNEKGVLHSSCGEDLESASPKCEDSAIAQDVSDSQGGGMLVCNDEKLPNMSEVDPVIKKEACDFVVHDACDANADKDLILTDKIDTAEPQDDCDVDSKCHPVSSIGSYRTSDLLEDNSSQYEDGELIEAAEQGDNVHVDMEICGTSPIHCRVSDPEQVQAKKNVVMEVAPVISSDVGCMENEAFMKSTKNVESAGTVGDDETDMSKLNHSAEEKMKGPRNDLLENRKISSEVATKADVGGGIDDAITSHGDGLLESKGTATRMEHTKTYRRGLRSQIEGPITHDVSSKDERLNRMENRYGESSSVRPYERVRYPFNNKGRGQHGDSWGGSFDGRRGFKRHYSPIRRAPKLDDDDIMERDGMRIVDTLNDASYSHRVLLRGQSGTHEDAYADLHSRNKPDRKFSPDRAVTFGRGRSFRYGPSVHSRVGRVRCNGPPEDNFQSTLKYQRPLSRRERSFSPFEGRGLSNAHHSRGKSPSRSRSRSPTMWQSPRGRLGAANSGSGFYRHRNRSPDFRSEVRVQRIRSPHNQAGSVADHAMGMRPFARNHVSPPHSRWTSARKDEICHFREFGYKQRISGLEKPPGRAHMRGNRADVMESQQNLKLDGQYRISEDVAGRGFGYEENYVDRRKQHGPIRCTRQNYEDGMSQRLNLDVNDGFPTNNIRDIDASNFQGRRLRGIGSRIGDVPRRLRGEQHSFMYERDEKFNSSSKKFGVDVMDSSSNLQSEDQYQSTHVYRPNRGRRYENYEGRAKQYGAVGRYTDMEPTGKRLNYNVDENFQDAPDFHGRGMRKLDGRNCSASTRIDDKAVVCEQEKLSDNLSDNPQSTGAQNLDDNDVKK